jgi:hypothetical protein
LIRAIENSVSTKSRLNEQVKDYLMSLHANNEDKKQHYGAIIGSFVDFLANKGIERFEDTTKTHIGQFLSTKRSLALHKLWLEHLKHNYQAKVMFVVVALSLGQQVLSADICPDYWRQYDAENDSHSNSCLQRHYPTSYANRG